MHPRRRRLERELFSCAPLLALLLLCLTSWGSYRGRRQVAAQAETATGAVDAESQGGAVTETAGRPQLVGREVCGECHKENHRLHAQHGHASTFHRTAETQVPKRFAGKTFDAGPAYGTYHYQATADDGLAVAVAERSGGGPFPLQYVLGSGLHAQTMLTLATEKDGATFGIEHRVSLYADDRLGLTPAHSQKQPEAVWEVFGDRLSGAPLRRCIECHTTAGEIQGERIVGLVAHVNCEKCHGPGSEHVRAARQGSSPPPYSVGRATWDAEAEIQLCGDCHRMPHSVTEREIREYPDLLVRFQPIGLLRSPCYLESAGRLKCSTCHPPHQTIRTVSADTHLANCLQCHQGPHESHPTCPVSATTGCVECHMPAIELETGLQFHDHWIRIRGD